MPSRPCLGSTLHPLGHTLVVGGSRCPECAQHVEARRTRAKRQRRPYTHAEQVRRAKAVAKWQATFGNVCPGWRRDAHAVQLPNILTADHGFAVGSGGREDGPLSVLCRDCNSTKQHRT